MANVDKKYKTSCILAIGSELTEGSIVDSNSAFIASHLVHYGVHNIENRHISDDRELLTSVLAELHTKYDIVFTTGGLGPTFDDITAECVAASVGRSLEKNKNAMEHLLAKLKELNFPYIPERQDKQTLLPIGARTLANELGTALGFITETRGRYIISLPGVPHEMKNMLTGVVKSFLQDELGVKPDKYFQDLAFAGLPEVDAEAIMKSIPEFNDPNISIIINAGTGENIIRVRGDKAIVKSFCNKMLAQCEKYYTGDGVVPLAQRVVEGLAKYGLTLSCAESCTGGMLSEAITDIAGSSSVFLGGIVVYSNEAKINILGVNEATLDKHGAVSEETAIEMSQNAQRVFSSKVAVSITGIAGPTGGTAEKPVGTVFVSIQYKDKECLTKKLFIKKDRQTIRKQTVNNVLTTILQLINKYEK